MKFIIGVTVVVGSMLAGFLMHQGQLMLLYMPSEYVIIAGMAVGSLILANPPRVLKGVLRGLAALIRKGGKSRRQYTDMLLMIYELMQLARREGVLALEGHVNDPQGSPIISKYPSFASDPHGVAFFCDTLKLFVAGVLEPHPMDELMERDLEVMSHEALEPSEAVRTVADALPALGIVAAVLGIILTMQAIDQGAAVVGVKVAGALVGTLLGVFLAYGFVGPFASAMASNARSGEHYYACIRHVLFASISGVNPPMAVEIGRRNIPSADRPSFEELEEALREIKKG
ncbi:MAG: flagellar motor stator protein MotA [Myxococcota bacterium]